MTRYAYDSEGERYELRESQEMKRCGLQFKWPGWTEWIVCMLPSGHRGPHSTEPEDEGILAAAASIAAGYVASGSGLHELEVAARSVRIARAIARIARAIERGVDEVGE